MNAPQILFEDPHLLIANKQSGEVVIPQRNGTREQALIGKLEQRFGKLFVVHRIDKPTSGIVCFARNAEAHRSMNLLFENRQVQKTYLAIVSGKLKTPQGSIDFPLAENPAKPGTMKVFAKGKEAITDFELIEQFNHAAFVKFIIHTGRMHQIRVHAAAIGNPLLVDDIYANSSEFFISRFISNYKGAEREHQRPTIARLTLHAASIGFVHPVSGESLTVISPLPADMEVLLKLLRKHDAL